ncbi:UNVERIFIED_CONTAM: hypothetical protein Sangu_2883100 [Sesamum angustifolium]|uniref:DDE Tnp4 domain-containing protein n=1 Tax=Sesamum angustifolium TaxID=2727405 RepID=A0AAW2IN73_9LAMI
MHFIYVLAGWEGSAANGRVLRDAVSKPNGLKIPRGNYYLVDSAYSNGEEFLLPYRVLAEGSGEEEFWEYTGTVDCNPIWNTWSSKIHLWKKTHACITDILVRSGFGWNKITQMTVVSDEVFDSDVKIDPFAKTFRFKSFSYYSAWTKTFGRNRATWEHTEYIYNASNNVSNETFLVSLEYHVPSSYTNVFGDDHEYRTL